MCPRGPHCNNVRMAPDPTPPAVLFVCLGNICRSPIAEAALRSAAADAGLSVTVDSAGTAAYHIGKPADSRAVSAARRADLDVTSIARQATVDDFADFDLIVAMDRANLRDLQDLAPDAESRERLVLFSHFTDHPETDVPDPYYGGADGFDEVVMICRDGAAGLVRTLSTT